MSKGVDSLPAKLTWQQLELMTGIQAQFRQELLAQNIGEIQEVDILGDMQEWWNEFIDSGQVWALIIGVVLGYIFKSFTG